jgi:hypothetical protein
MLLDMLEGDFREGLWGVRQGAKLRLRRFAPFDGVPKTRRHMPACAVGGGAYRKTTLFWREASLWTKEELSFYVSMSGTLIGISAYSKPS